MSRTAAGFRYGGGLTSPYTDPQYQTKIPFGQHSQYIQPWRAAWETVSAKQFLNALGVGLDVQNGQHMDLIVQMLARHGIKKHAPGNQVGEPAVRR